ncbi:uncharacterized protein LOC110703842 [Chenopodium quinoa]|uniref:uncharacterized protein LOC110703842 n=1 Tax=Chenopodium quinoa TaxID=63459 RepID=UPI000B77A757|nr:uncharacterized protein LOC110703842 [Chenopodium quinoa]
MAKDDENPTPPPPPFNDYHPANSISNIKNDVPEILNRDKGNYNSWVELFEIHCHSCNVIDHIDPKSPRPTDLTTAQWNLLDSIMKKWIYNTISADLRSTVLYKHATAQETWDKLANIFQDNGEIRSIYLENQFNNLFVENFPDVSSYCQKLKELKDQLANVGQPVFERTLVLHLCAGLIDSVYDEVAQSITQIRPLPGFDEARSRILLEESRKSAKENSGQAFVTQTSNTTTTSAAAAQQQQPPQQQARGGGGSGRGSNCRRRGGVPKGKGRGRVQN